MVGLAVAAVLLARPRRATALGSPHDAPPLPRSWPSWGLAIVAAILLGSIVGIGPGGRLHIQDRWAGSLHRLTWGVAHDPPLVDDRVGIPRGVGYPGGAERITARRMRWGMLR